MEAAQASRALQELRSSARVEMSQIEADVRQFVSEATSK